MTNRLVLLAKVMTLLLATCAVTAPVRSSTDPRECSGAAAAVSRRDSTEALSIEINVPAFRLDVRERGVVTASYRIAVGMRTFPTPIGDYQMDYLIWNPRWVPPDRSWARHERPQPPGPDNWMGRVKLHVRDLIFIHGSPFERSLGSAASHACMRMRNDDVVALATTVLAYAGSDLTPAGLDSVERDPRRTRYVTLARSVPVHVRYVLAEIRGDSLAFHTDVYRQRGADARATAWSALRSVGIDSTSLDPSHIEAALRQARRHRVAISLDSLRALAADPTLRR